MADHLRLMNRHRWLAVELFSALVIAWWNAWDDLWEQISSRFDLEYQRDLASIEKNDDIGAVESGGNFYAAGCGSDGD